MLLAIVVTDGPYHRAWVAKCLGQMTDANKKEAQEELRQVIAESFANKSLWTTDWDGVQLQRFSTDSLAQVAVYDLCSIQSSSQSSADVETKAVRTCMNIGASSLKQPSGSS